MLLVHSIPYAMSMTILEEDSKCMFLSFFNFRWLTSHLISDTREKSLITLAKERINADLRRYHIIHQRILRSERFNFNSLIHKENKIKVNLNPFILISF